MPPQPPTFEEALLRLQAFWRDEGCLLWRPMNAEVGAGTMNPATFLRVLGSDPWNVAYVEPSVRPDDSRYGDNPNRMQTHTQYQVILKPDTGRPVEQYLRSLEVLGVDVAANDIRFVEDNWESPALGAWGLGWEVWLNGLEITQFTYFQQAGGFTLDPVSVEITYGLERILMALQRRSHFKDIEYAPGITYGELVGRDEREMSSYYLDAADVSTTRELFDAYESEADLMLERELVLPAYRQVLAMSHLFNVLDARGAVGIAERAAFFARMRRLSRACAELWISPQSDVPAGEPAPPVAAATSGADAPDTAGVPSGPRTLVLEVGTEELPSADIELAVDALRSLVPRVLADSRLAHGRIDVHATPRRLVVLVREVAARQEDLHEQVRGPKAAAAIDSDGSPSKAAIGFAGKHGMVPEQLRRVEFKGQEYLVADVERAGRNALDVLAEELPGVLKKIAFRRGMRWNASGVAFSRPVRWLLALLGDRVVPFEFADLATTRFTRPLRGAGGDDVAVASADDYEPLMARLGAITDREARREEIWRSVQALGAAAGGEVPAEYRGALLTEVADLVEAPMPLRGSFGEEFLSLPPEVLRTVMVKHQRFFPIVADGRVLPGFVAVANGANDARLVREGNEAVIHARYSDAKFFYDQDIKRPFASYRERLRTLTFDDRLGSMLEKTERLEVLATWLAQELRAAEPGTVVRAAQLAKNDLVTAMVIEFSGLAGTMGRYYALAAGEPADVADAIRDHLRPVDAGDAPPRGLAGAIVGIGDRLDTLVGLFGVGVRPRSSADPYALRRTAYGLVQILVHHGVELNLELAVDRAAALQPVDVSSEAKREVLDFVWRRLEVSLRDAGLPHDVVAAAVGATRPSVAAKHRAANELHALAGSAELQQALAGHTRVARILAKQPDADTAVSESLFETSYESDLWQAVLELEADRAWQGSVPACVRAFSRLTAPIDDLFENVMVMSDDPLVAANRLALLRRVATLPAPLADLTQLRAGVPGLDATKDVQAAAREPG